MYTINGFIKDTNNNFITNAKVYAYFNKVDASSSNAKWASPNYVTDKNGYYSITLEDDQWLGINGAYKRTSDTIWIAVVWNDSNSGLATLTTGMTHASFIEHTMKTSDVNSINLTLELIRLPIFDSSVFTNTNILTQTTYTISENSHADYTFKTLEPYSTTPITQINTYKSISIFPNHIMDTTEYTWGDGTIGSTRFKPNITSDSFVYAKAGVFTQKIKIREKWGTYREVTRTVTVKYNEPIIDFDYTPKSTNSWEGNKIKGTEEITFTNTSSDKDNRTKDNNKWLNETYYYEWIISDKKLDGSDNTKTYSSKDWYFSPKHKFQSAGDKIITLKMFWNDGFADKIKIISKTLTIDAFNIVPDFSWSKIPRHRNDLITFTSTTTGDVSSIVKYNWVISDNFPLPGVDLYTFSNTEPSFFSEGSPDNTKRVDNVYNIESTENKTAVKFHSTEIKNIKLTITYFNGWEDVTKEISKTLTPNKIVIEPNFSISGVPQGRHENVVFNNTTNYMFGVYNLSYSVDWKIYDFYTAHNLDNPNYGVITNNNKYYLNRMYNESQNHYFQNSGTNNVELTIRYDDGFQMQTKRLTKTVTPVVFDGIVPDFIFNQPNSRHDDVFITNKTVDTDNRFRKMEYFLSDQYNKYNPDNPNYGVATTDNSKHFETTDKNEIFHHFYQDSITEDIELLYYYDDGFEEQVLSKEKNITKILNSIVPDFKTDILPIDMGFVGKKEINFMSDSIEIDVKVLDEKWVFNDRIFETEDDNITIRNDELPYLNQKFTFITPSRMPFSSKEHIQTGLPNVKNYNKTVSLEIRVDNGWRDDTELKNYKDLNNSHNKEIGGQVYFYIEKDYEASPNELVSEIKIETNIYNYKHN